MNRLQKLAQVNKAARHVLRTRQIKKAYDQNWVDMVKYLAETGQLAPESIEAIQKEHDKGRLMSALQRATKGGLRSGLLGTGLGAVVGALAAANEGAPIGQPAMLGAGAVGGASTLLGAGLNGIWDLIEYNKNKKQLKSILDAVNTNAPQSSVATTPASELTTAAMV